MRTAGDLINAYLREGRLAANRSQPIGAGGYGSVYESDVPGNVIKQLHGADVGQRLKNEVDMQAVAAEMGIAPRIDNYETFQAGVGDRIEMQDIRKNFEAAPETKQTDLDVAKQLGQLALKGVRLEDRNPNNVFVNKMTGRPMQIDFGVSGPVKDDYQKAATLALATDEGFKAAGIGQMGDILVATVMDLLEGGMDAEAMDVARQGFSRLQKIKNPLSKSVDLLA